MVPEATLEQTDAGLVAKGDGWFVLNAKDSRWYHAEGRPAVWDVEGETQFSRLGFRVFVLGRREPMSMYHWEADQEDFLVLSGQGLLIVEGEERPLGAWDFVHCPPETKHVLIGAGSGPRVVVAVGARDARSTIPTGRVSRRPGRASPRRRRRAGDERYGRGVRERHASAAHAVSAGVVGLARRARRGKNPEDCAFWIW